MPLAPAPLAQHLPNLGHAHPPKQLEMPPAERQQKPYIADIEAITSAAEGLDPRCPYPAVYIWSVPGILVTSHSGGPGKDDWLLNMDFETSHFCHAVGGGPEGGREGICIGWFPSLLLRVFHGYQGEGDGRMWFAVEGPD